MSPLLALFSIVISLAISIYLSVVVVNILFKRFRRPSRVVDLLRTLAIVVSVLIVEPIIVALILYLIP